MSQTPRRRSVVLNGHHTSVSLEDEFWEALREIADAQECSMNALIAEIDGARRGNLSSAIRLYVLDDLRSRVGPRAD